MACRQKAADFMYVNDDALFKNGHFITTLYGDVNRIGLFTLFTLRCSDG